jgi:preprotein translocase subunit YajC
MNNLIDALPVMQGAGGTGGSMATTFITFAGVIAVFYFFILRPQSRKQKEAQKMLSEVKKFDKVVTIGGIRGVVQAVKDTTVIIKVDDNTKIEFNKSAISAVLEKHEVKNEKTDVSETN